jgi:hypothetical protein
MNSHVSCKALSFPVPPEAAAVLDAAPSVTVATSAAQLVDLAVRDEVDGWHEVAYDVPGRGRVVEARVCRVKNGINANYLEPYMRRRDPDCMVIGDTLPTDKPTYQERFGGDFAALREETFAWLKTQDLAVFPFYAGMVGKGTDALVIAPANAGFFAYGLALLQGILAADEIPEGFAGGHLCGAAIPAHAFRRQADRGAQPAGIGARAFQFQSLSGAVGEKRHLRRAPEYRGIRALGHHALFDGAGGHAV